MAALKRTTLRGAVHGGDYHDWSRYSEVGKVLQIHGVDDPGAVVTRKRVSRARMFEFFAGLPRCLIGIEAFRWPIIGPANRGPLVKRTLGEFNPDRDMVTHLRPI
jgi:hypothetical protein